MTKRCKNCGRGPVFSKDLCYNCYHRNYYWLNPKYREEHKRKSRDNMNKIHHQRMQSNKCIDCGKESSKLGNIRCGDCRKKKLKNERIRYNGFDPRDIKRDGILGYRWI